LLIESVSDGRVESELFTFAVSGVECLVSDTPTDFPIAFLVVNEKIREY
jgi:hypothetical protein